MNKQKVRLFDKIEIGVASPKQIRDWAERYLPHGDVVGEVTSWETVNYKTLKPEPNGLFCQKIFGPTVDFTCACGKKGTKTHRGFCPKCGVERTQSRVRRYRLGYIKLKQPVVHPLYASHRPSPLTLCLNWSTKRFQAVMKTAEFCSLPKKFTIFRSKRESRFLFSNSIAVPFQKTGFATKFEDGLAPKFNFVDKNTVSHKIREFWAEKGKEPPLVFEHPLGGIDLAAQKTSFPAKFENFGKGQYSTPDKQSGTPPRLFSKKNSLVMEIEKKATRRFFSFNQGTSEPRLYGIAYDATWRHVEEFQEFLFYLWEQSFYYESSVSYYAFTKPIKSHKQEIPRHEHSYALQSGGFAFQQILSYLDRYKLQKEIETHALHLQRAMQFLYQKMRTLHLNIFEERKEFKRLKLKLYRLYNLRVKCKRQIQTFRDFHQANLQPAWMILSYLPVLPPGLRPITSIRGELVVSDINSLYRKVLIRNKRITRGAHFGVFDTALSGSWLSWCYNLRQVQEAVDELLKSGSVESGKPLKSLLEGLKGKQGRFRQHLLGKRVDYSGRSVIVVGPELKLHQCGLPKQMAIELFQPFLIQKLRKKGIVFTTTAAKALIAERKPIVWSILSEILKTHPILLNRAPTLHRLGIQAFLPKLVQGKAILLHPLVCPAFNADFDGDQMAVHVPLSSKTQAEALKLLWSRNHILAPASGQPLLLPTQDMVLGFYYLTCSQERFSQTSETLIPSQKALLENHALSSQNRAFGKKNELQFFSQKDQGSTADTAENTNTLYFSKVSHVKKAYDRGFLNLHTPIWLKRSTSVQTFIPEHQARTHETIIETRIDLCGRGETLFIDTSHLWDQQNCLDFSRQKSQFIRTTTGRVLMHSWIFQESAPLSVFLPKPKVSRNV